MARSSIREGNGAQRASINADSYAWLANSAYFFKTYGRYPLPSNYKPTSADDEQILPVDLEDRDPIMIHVGDFDGDAEISPQTAEALFDKSVRGFMTELKDVDKSPETDPNEKINPPNPPRCEKSGVDSMPEDQAKAAIVAFCDNIEQWNDTRIVPLIGYGTGNTKKNGKGKSKSLGVYSEGPKVDGTKAKIWTGVTFVQESCQGYSKIASGKPDEDKAECKAYLQTILSGCGGAGGTLQVSCQSWYLKLSEKNPSDEHWKDKGAVKCRDTCSNDDKKCREALGDGPVADACTCFYEKYDTVTAQFNRPDSGNCNADDVNLGDLFAG